MPWVPAFLFLGLWMGSDVRTERRRARFDITPNFGLSDQLVVASSAVADLALLPGQVGAFHGTLLVALHEGRVRYARLLLLDGSFRTAGIRLTHGASVLVTAEGGTHRRPSLRYWNRSFRGAMNLARSWPAESSAEQRLGLLLSEEEDDLDHLASLVVRSGAGGRAPYLAFLLERGSKRHRTTVYRTATPGEVLELRDVLRHLSDRIDEVERRELRALLAFFEPFEKLDRRPAETRIPEEAPGSESSSDEKRLLLCLPPSEDPRFRLLRILDRGFLDPSDDGFLALFSSARSAGLSGLDLERLLHPAEGPVLWRDLRRACWSPRELAEFRGGRRLDADPEVNDLGRRHRERMANAADLLCGVASPSMARQRLGMLRLAPLMAGDLAPELLLDLLGDPDPSVGQEAVGIAQKLFARTMRADRGGQVTAWKQGLLRLGATWIAPGADLLP